MKLNYGSFYHLQKKRRTSNKRVNDFFLETYTEAWPRWPHSEETRRKKLIVFLRFYKRRKLELLHEVHTSLIMSVTFASKVRYDVGIFMHITKEVCFCFDNLQWFLLRTHSHSHTYTSTQFSWALGLGHIHSDGSGTRNRILGYPESAEKCV